MEENSKVNNTIFDDFTINDLFKKIYLNHHEKEKLITDLFEDLKLLVIDSTAATLVGPVIKDLAQTSVNNDDLLIKLANVATKVIDNPSKRKDVADDIITFSNTEKNELLKKMNELEVTIENES
jgi:hypothetical protein